MKRLAAVLLTCAVLATMFIGVSGNGSIVAGDIRPIVLMGGDDEIW